MRRILVALAAVLALTLSASGVMAQDTGTPVASPAATDSTGGSVDPAVGEAAVYVDVSGNPIANVTIDSVERDWQGFAEFSEPDPGVEYIAFTITVESVINRGAVEVSDFDFSLQDASGFLNGTTFADAADGEEVVPLEDDVQLASGETATFLVVFEVLQGQEVAHLFWQPDSGRLITLASLEGQ